MNLGQGVLIERRTRIKRFDFRIAISDLKCLFLVLESYLYTYVMKTRLFDVNLLRYSLKIWQYNIIIPKGLGLTTSTFPDVVRCRLQDALSEVFE